MGTECEASDHTGGWAVDSDLTGKDVRLSLQGMQGARATGTSQDKGRQAVVGAPGWARGNLVGRNKWTLPFHPEGVEASGTARGRASQRARIDSPGCRPSGRAWVAPPMDGLVLYRDRNSSPSSIERVKRTASKTASPFQSQQDVRMRKLLEGASAVPQVGESSAATVHVKAQQKYPSGGTPPDSSVPILLGRQGQDVFHLPGLEESPVSHPCSLHGGRGSALAGRICRGVQTGPMGTVPRAGRERDQPGLPARPDPSEAVWPVPRPG